MLYFYVSDRRQMIKAVKNGQKPREKVGYYEIFVEKWYSSIS